MERVLSLNTKMDKYTNPVPNKASDELARLKAQLQEVQKSLRTVTSKMALQRQSAQKFIARCRLQIEQIGERCREEQIQHEKKLRDMTSKLTLLEEQVAKEKREIQMKVSEKTSIIEEQQTRLLKMTAVNNQLAAAIARIKQQLTTEDLSGRANLTGLHVQPAFHLGHEFDVDWDINREAFDVNQGRSVNQVSISNAKLPVGVSQTQMSNSGDNTKKQTVTYISQQNLYIGRRGYYCNSSLLRARSMPVLDAENGSAMLTVPSDSGSVVGLNTDDDTSALDVSALGRAQSVDALDATPTSQRKSRSMFTSHENLSMTRMPLSLPREGEGLKENVNNYGRIPSDMSMSEKKERAKRRFLKPKDIKKRHRDKSVVQPCDQTETTTSKGRSVFKIFSFAF